MKDNLNNVKMDKARDRYHHGALRETLVAVGEALLAERGLSGFSLREVARRAGVSPAAPAHHFRDARGLLTALATKGFERLAEALAEARGPAPDRRPRAQAEAYVDFALKNGALFSLMWMRDILDADDPQYLAAGRAAFNLFERTALGHDLPAATGPHRPEPVLVAAWAMIHGYARLALDGALDDDPALLAAVLDHMPLALRQGPA